MKNRTSFIYDNRFTRFYQNDYETPDRITWIYNRIKDSGIYSDLNVVEPQSDPDNWIKKIHSTEHITIIKSYSSFLDFDKVGTIAELAVSYILGAVRDVCSGKVKNAFCCIRPPGHHVMNSGALGYCYYGNIAIADKFARENLGIKKTLIVDWDFHQGNGTHTLLCNNPDVLFFETFADTIFTVACNDFRLSFPSTPLEENARRVTIKMPVNAGNDDFIRLYEENLIAAAERFKPELILISAGFDLKANDTHGSFQVTAAGISRMTKIIMDIAESHCNGKIVSMLEGGYADRVRDNTIPGLIPTYSGLCQCSESHVKTLLTGELQNESPYFRNSRVISTIPGKNSQGIQFDGRFIICNDTTTPSGSLTISDIQGKVLKTVVFINAEPIDSKSLNLQPGHYIISYHNGKMYYSKSITMM
jgi:acetoin utilization deacetylase AcuC-like enzyme